MFTYMVARALEKGKQAIIFTDRVELLKQSNGALDLFGIKPTLIEASKTRLDVSGNCFIAMAQTFSRRKDAVEYTDLLNRMDLVIIDEAHKQTFNPLLPYINPKAVVIKSQLQRIASGVRLNHSNTSARSCLPMVPSTCRALWPATCKPAHTS